MFYVFSLCGNIFSLGQSFAHTDTGHLFPFCRQDHYRISVFTVLKHNVVYKTCNRLHFYSSYYLSVDLWVSRLFSPNWEEVTAVAA